MLTNSQIKFIRSLSSKKARVDSGVFSAEGDKLISDLLPFLELSDCYEIGVNCTALQMQKISQLRTPTSKLALFKIPTYDTPLSSREQGAVLVLDSVQDPGNLGTIIRSADWFGISTIVCSLDTVDVFSPKVVQATMGSIGRVKVLYADLPQWLGERSRAFGGSIYGTFLDNSTPLSAVEFAPNATIVMGNEGSGISAEVERLISNRVFIERAVGGGGESLNVATATAIIISRL